MPLSEALNSHTVISIKLMEMNTIPTTEDLLYMLATASQNRKPVELPFKNPYNNLRFNVRVIPATLQIAPRWSFERRRQEGSQLLWTRETNEVIMVQGKIKIESNYGDNEPVQAEQINTGSQPIIMGGAAASQTAASPSISASNLAALSAREEEEAAEKHPPIKKGSTWLFNENCQGPVALPPPVALDGNVLKNYTSALSHPDTGFYRHSALEFLLWRDLQYVKRYGLKMSLLIFDYVDPDKKETIKISKEGLKTLSHILGELCTPLEVYSQLRSGEIAILLCGQGSAAALEFAKKIIERLGAVPTEISAGANLNTLAIGAAGIPDTCKDPGTMIAAALKAKSLARQAKQTIALFPLF